MEVDGVQQSQATTTTRPHPPVLKSSGASSIKGNTTRGQLRIAAQNGLIDLCRKAIAQPVSMGLTGFNLSIDRHISICGSSGPPAERIPHQLEPHIRSRMLTSTSSCKSHVTYAHRYDPDFEP
ncbi:hypothetical protein ZHAS_00019002 [Anopheles sinensis]|uniref:Uncharacterized protein n=1 Tax=Anopheles sinensis TaxID=74873 RepID=A0A084WL66_ANOSI|nr:hypothetical protein ZHAS_00019002 [Anopheles sinensis]